MLTLPSSHSLTPAQFALPYQLPSFAREHA